LILEVFHLHGRLLAFGDKLTADKGLSSARWKVMGAVEEQPLTVPQIARRMGLTRQAVQRIANDLVKMEMIEFIDNPDHARAKLIQLTKQGCSVLEEIGRRQIQRVNKLATDLKQGELKTTLSLLQTVRERLE
jgi:DNA-binding MarR family transcriptional regulator